MCEYFYCDFFLLLFYCLGTMHETWTKASERKIVNIIGKVILRISGNLIHDS